MSTEQYRPVVHRGVRIGSARNERGALSVAARRFRASSRERHTARLAEWVEDTGTDLVFHGQAWHVGVQLRRTS